MKIVCDYVFWAGRAKIEGRRPTRIRKSSQLKDVKEELKDVKEESELRLGSSSFS